MNNEARDSAAWLQLVRRQPLRLTAGRRLEGPPIERGFWVGLEEATEDMARILGGQPEAARAFEGHWSALRVGGAVAAPGLPVVAVETEQEGPGGVYHRAPDGEVIRECGLGQRPYLEFSKADQAPSLDLLWFDDSASYHVEGGDLVIDDLFGRLRLPATRNRIEHELVRRRRLSEAVLEGVATGSEGEPARLSVHQSASPPPEPERLLRARLDLERVRPTSDGFIARHAGGAELRFGVNEGDSGTWTMHCSDDPRGIEILNVGHERVEARLAPSVDPLQPGWRIRLVFDLRADLAAAGAAQKV